MTRPWDDFCANLVRDHSLGSLLLNGPLSEPALERQLTSVRRACLFNGGGPLALLAHLAIQGFLNEFVWAVEPAEAARAEALWAAVSDGRLRTPEALLVAACYRSLAELPDAGALLKHAWPDTVRAVLREQVANSIEERAIEPTIPTLTPLRGRVSEAVRDQYESHPYPRWVAMPVARQPPTPDMLIRMFPAAGAAPLPPGPDVMIAGCGTGLHALGTAKRHPDGKVLAVDLSRASLAFAKRRANEGGVGNIEFAQADLLELAALGRSFDIIECVGVLHHLEDPFEGARVLGGMLRPGGAMKLGFYSATARRPLAPAKALARTYGVGRIRDLRAAIANASPDDPVRFAQTFGDFNSASACRDLLLHVQEHEMEVADVRRMLDEAGLRFLGFSNKPDIAAAYREMFPDDPAMTDLDHWEAFERLRPRTFIGMYQFWGQRA